LFLFTYMEQAIVQGVFPLFEKELVQELETQSESRHFKPGEPLIRTGQYIRTSMLIISGLVKVYREDEEGNEFFMYYLQPGQACALSMICATRQQTSAIMAKAVKETEVMMVSPAHIDQWMLKYKSWNQFVLNNYRSRFEELLVTVDHIAFRSMDERLEFYLKKHQDTLHTNLLPLSHQEIADELNSSREVISRLLKKMEQMGKVRLHRNAIELI
jgi:CRP/FNR family transcriptional regulator, anaerobic regulatory protein